MSKLKQFIKRIEADLNSDKVHVSLRIDSLRAQVVGNLSDKSEAVVTMEPWHLEAMLDNSDGQTYSSTLSFIRQAIDKLK